jgi:hypothetical protein
VHGVDDFVVVDPLQVHGGDAEIGVAELALDHIQRHPFARHFDGVRMSELVRGVFVSSRPADLPPLGD